MSLKVQRGAPTILGIIIGLEKKKKLKSICSEEKVHSLTRAFNFNLGCVTVCSNHYFLFFPLIFYNGSVTITTIITNFIPLFWQWHYHKSITIFFFPFYFDNIIVINPFHNFLFYFLEMICAHLTCGLAVKSYLWKILAYLTCGLAVSTLDFAGSFNYTLKSPLPSGDSRLITWSKSKSTFTKLQT